MGLDLLVTGMPRSGTTLVANLLTMPPKAICMVEPGSFSVPIQNKAYKAASSLGLKPKSNSSKDVLEVLTNIKWGIKEVKPDIYNISYRRLKPKKVAVCIRDARDIAISLKEMFRTKDKSTESVSNRVQNYASSLLSFLKEIKDPIFIKYEKLCDDDTYLKRIEDQLGWKMRGNPSRGLASYGRGDEVRDGIFCRRTKIDRKNNKDLISSVNEKCTKYQKKFNYN